MVMRVLLCHNYYQQAGGEDQVFAAEGNLLRSAGHTVHEFSVHNDAIEGMSRWSLARRTIWNPDSARRIAGVIRDVRPNVMHCHNTFPLLSPSIYEAAAEAGVAVVQTLHNYRLLCPNAQLLRKGQPCELCMRRSVAWPAVAHACYRESRPASAVVAAMLAYHRMRGTWQRGVDRFIALTEFAKEKFVEAGFAPERIAVKPNFLDVDPGPGPGGDRRVTFVGRLSPEKGIVTLLKAWKKLASPIRLTVVGDGPLGQRVAEAASGDPRIQWLGRRPLAEVCDIVGASSCLVMPSIWYETFGRTIIEAFAVGTPVIASRLGAMAELVRDPRYGRLFPAGDSDALVAAIESFFGESRDRAAAREAVRGEFLARYTAASNLPRLLSIYQNAIQERDGAPAVRWKTASSL